MAKKGQKGPVMPQGKKHTPEQIVRILRDAEAAQAAGKSVSQICQEVGISDKSYYRWKSLYGGMKTTELRRLKELEAENLRLKKLVADLSLDNAMLKELAEGNF
jgi:putative transposase